MFPVDVIHVLGLLGMLAIGGLLLLLGVLSRQLGAVTQAAPHYRAFYIGAVLVSISVLARFWNYAQRIEIDLTRDENVGWVLLYNGLPALSVTIGLFAAWRYWSWLLAERD